MAMDDNNNNTIVLYPSPGRSHLVPMVELGKLLLTHHPSFSITIIISTFPNAIAGDTSNYIASVSAATPGINFHLLPTISASQLDLTHHPTIAEVPRLRGQLALLNNPNLHQTLVTLSKALKLKALIIDFFCKAALQVSSKLNIPTYFFFTSGASALAQILYLLNTYESTNGLTDPQMVLDIPGLPPIRAKEIFLPDKDGSGRANKAVIDTAIQMKKSSGIIINTFETLEQRAIKALNGEQMPPVYCIGPILGDNKNDEHVCLNWLDSQPSQSVVFLCFGSMGFFCSKQLKEISMGLERSGVRFLWVVRIPPPEDEFRRTLAVGDGEMSVEIFLPEGFLERTKGRGMVVESWAPQVAVLSHDSVGGFVTHCGWNSVLEAVCAGVPMVAWPFVGDQMVNRAFLVEEIKVALTVELVDGLVSAGELEERVTELMDSETGKGRVIRDEIRELQDQAMGALSEGGCSLAALAELVESFKE